MATDDRQPVNDGSGSPLASAGRTRLFADTTPEAEEYYVQAIRRMTPAEKMDRIRELSLRSRRMIEADILRKHPTASEHELKMRLVARWHGPEIALRFFGWDVEVEGY